MRLRREWAVRVAQGAVSLPAAPAGHGYYTLARIKRAAGNTTILAAQIEDLRTVGINLADLAAEIIDARGMKGNVGNRLDESLTKGGQLRFNVVGNDQVQADAAINESKILFADAGHDHSGGTAGNTIGTNGLENFAVTTNKLADLSVTNAKLGSQAVTAAKISDNAVTTTKIADDAVRRDKLDLTILNNGTIVDLSPGTYTTELVQANVAWQDGLKRIYMPVVAITSVTGTGTADIRHEFVYRSISGRDTYDVYIRISNEAGGSEKVDIYWYVYIFAEN